MEKIELLCLDLQGAWHKRRAYPTVKENAAQERLVPLHPQLLTLKQS